MADVNEEIVEQYLKIVKKWFYVGDVTVKVPYNYSNIDVLAYDPKLKRYYDLEVKFSSSYSLSNSDDGIMYLVNQFKEYKREGHQNSRIHCGEEAYQSDCNHLSDDGQEPSKEATNGGALP